MEQKQFDIISIIASRKAEFYVNAGNQLLSSLPSNVDKKQTETRLRQVIAELDNRLFISEEEKASNMIKPGVSIAQLKLDTQAILDQIIKGMTEA
jgi:hypothetical protein